MESSTNHILDQLDRERLHQLYGDDTEMLVSSIRLFLDEVMPNFLELQKLIPVQDWTGIAELAHQLRSWLAMVGLTSLENKLWLLEELVRTNPDQEIIRASYEIFYTGLTRMALVLKSELQRINYT